MVTVIISLTFFSCSDPTSENNVSKIIYERVNASSQELKSHYKTIQMIEEISPENKDYKHFLKKFPSIEDTNQKILKYSYDGELFAYRIGSIFIYVNDENIFPIKVTENTNLSGEKIISISDAVNATLYYELTTKEFQLIDFKQFNDFPLEVLDFDENINNVLDQKAAECDDLGWSACMDCTVRYCGTKWWCVGLLATAGPETIAAMAVSCTVNL